MAKLLTSMYFMTVTLNGNKIINIKNIQILSLMGVAGCVTSIVSGRESRNLRTRVKVEDCLEFEDKCLTRFVDASLQTSNHLCSLRVAFWGVGLGRSTGQ